MGGRKFKRSPITGGEVFIFAVSTAAPHRTHRVDHVPGFQPMAPCDFRAAGFAAT